MWEFRMAFERFIADLIAFSKAQNLPVVEGDPLEMLLRVNPLCSSSQGSSLKSVITKQKVKTLCFTLLI